MKASAVLILFSIIQFSTGVVGGFGNTMICRTKTESSKLKCTFEAKRIERNDQFIIIADHLNSTDCDIKEVAFLTSVVKAVPNQIFKKFENMDTLVLQSQNVEEISTDSFLNASKLSFLNLHDNKIKELKAHSFKGAEGLMKIHLHKNLLEVIDRDAFSGLTLLNEIHLHSNHIKHLHEDTFNPLLNVEILYLHTNQLTFLPKKLFLNNMKLKNLQLYSNKITALSNKMFSHLKSLQYLYLSGNVCATGDYTSSPYSRYATIESDLRNCLSNYCDNQENSDLLGRMDKYSERLDRIEKILVQLLENQETYMNKINNVA